MITSLLLVMSLITSIFIISDYIYKKAILNHYPQIQLARQDLKKRRSINELNQFIHKRMRKKDYVRFFIKTRLRKRKSKTLEAKKNDKKTH